LISTTVFNWSVRQVSAIVVISILLALSVDALRPEGIPLVKDWSVKTRMVDESGLDMGISLDDSIRAFEDGHAVFLDARSPSEYAQGHIKGARLLPFEEIDEYVIDATADLSPEALIITYCDGKACMLSHDLALYLKDFGFERVYVLTNGWSLWLDNGLPVEQDSTLSQEGGRG